MIVDYQAEEDKPNPGWTFRNFARCVGLTIAVGIPFTAFLFLMFPPTEKWEVLYFLSSYHASWLGLKIYDRYKYWWRDDKQLEDSE